MTGPLGDQYTSDDNLRRRQGLFQFAVPPTSPQPDLTSTFTWGDRATVLDVGCGNGMWAARALERTPDATVIGIDTSPGMARIFRERVGADALTGDIVRLPVASGSADAVLALWMLYHVPDKPAALAEVARVLRPGGFLVAATNSSQDDFGDLYRTALERVLGRTVTHWGPVLDFTIENGADILATEFPVIGRWVIETAFEIDRAEPIVAVAESLRDAILLTNPDVPFDSFLVALRDVVGERLRDAPIRFVRRSGFFKAERVG